MIRSKFANFLSVMAGVVTIGAQGAQAQSLDVVLKPIPQAYSNTCQSYALGFALSRAGAPGFSLQTVGEVRTVEAKVRAAIESQAKSLGLTPYDHAVWVSAVKVLTSDTYVLNRKEYASGEALMADIGAKTGITSASTLGPVLSVITSKTPVITSFKSIGANAYNTGHIVTVFGMDAPAGPLSVAPGLALLNSAVKKPVNGAPEYAPVCASSELPGDLKYTGAVSLEKTYELRTYGGRFVGFWISKK